MTPLTGSALLLSSLTLGDRLRDLVAVFDFAGDTAAEKSPVLVGGFFFDRTLLLALLVLLLLLFEEVGLAAGGSCSPRRRCNASSSSCDKLTFGCPFDRAFLIRSSALCSSTSSSLGVRRTDPPDPRRPAK